MVASGSWAPASGCDNQVEGKGEKREKATVSTHPKYSQARSYTTYVCIGIKRNKGTICGLNCRMPE